MSDGDAQKMVNGMITQLLIISDEAYQLTSTRMEKYIDTTVDLLVLKNIIMCYFEYIFIEI